MKQRLAIGTAQFGMHYGISNHGGQVTRQVAREIVSLARAGGVDMIDTAIAYGESEACLGEVGIEGCKVVTKLPPLPADAGNVAAWVHNQFGRSLRRLNANCIYGLLLHSADQLAGERGPALAKALHDLKQDGLVAKVGVSIYAPEQLARILPVCAIDLIQAPLNLLDRRLETSGWLQRLHDAGVEIHTRSAFLQGLLLMDRAVIPPRFERWSQIWNAWHGWLDTHSVSATRACLQYPLSLRQVDRIVVGVACVEEFKVLLNDAAVVGGATDLPDLACTDQDLINPSNWNQS